MIVYAINDETLSAAGYKHSPGHHLLHSEGRAGATRLYRKAILSSADPRSIRYFVNAFIWDFRDLGVENISASAEAELYSDITGDFRFYPGILEHTTVAAMEARFEDAYVRFECRPDRYNNDHLEGGRD